VRGGRLWLSGQLLGALLLAPWAAAQGGPPWARGFDLPAVLAAGEAALATLEVMGVYLHVHGPRGANRTTRVLLGDGGRVYARLTLDPSTLEPVPIGLEGFSPPPPATLEPQQALASLLPLPAALALSSVVVPEGRGYKLLLVYRGRIVGELWLTHDLGPDHQQRWVAEFARSAWRAP
jgi:hypothetical protein